MPAKPTTAIPTTDVRYPRVRIAVGRLAAAMLLTAAVVGVGAGLIAAAAVGVLDFKGIATATGVVLAGTGAGLAMLTISGARPVFGWAMLVIGASMVRLVLSLAVGTGVYVVAAPNMAVYWGAFLAASLAVLAVETVMVRGALMNPIPEEPRTESA